LKIDTVLGVVSFPGITIGPHLSRQEFLETRLGSTAKLGVVNAGWVTLHTQPEPRIYASMAFKDDRLVKLEVSMQMPSGEVGDYDRDCELRRQAYHDAWLKSELGGPPYEYLWGTVLSWYDAKSVVSEIMVIFGKYPVEESWRDRKRREREEAARKPA
jgi:hypothetical protein